MECTLIFPVRDDQVLLGMKKRGFGEGKWNGFGGKLNVGETPEVAALRELEEECGIKGSELDKIAELKFKQHDGSEFFVHAYILKNWRGEAVETEEMRPQWWNLSHLPFESMWDDDKVWLEKALDGQKLEGSFIFDEYNVVKEVTYLREAKHL